MEHVQRRQIATEKLPGRAIQKAVGKGSAVESRKMSVGFARYGAEYGPMEPHHHAEETIYVLAARSARVRYGPEKDRLPHAVELEAGMMLHFGELEWHVFEYDQGGSLDIIFIYGQVDNIRPEEIRK